MIIHTNPETQSAAVKLRGFWKQSEADKPAPVTSRPDLVAERNGEPVTVEHVTLSGDEHTSETERRAVLRAVGLGSQHRS